MCGRPPSSWASSSVGQSWRLITAWSRVQVLPGPPKKHEGFGLRASFLLIRTVLCSSGCESLCSTCHRPACRLQGWYWAVRVRLLRLLLPRRFPGWTRGCSQKCAGTYASEFFRCPLFPDPAHQCCIAVGVDGKAVVIADHKVIPIFRIAKA